MTPQLAAPPDTLPADFFDKQGAAPSSPPPSTLPADFFDKQPQAAAPAKTTAVATAPNPSDNDFIEQYKQNSMFRVARDLLGAASRDPETMQRAKETAAQLWQGLSGEPARVKNEFLAFWNQAQQGHFQGDAKAAIPHLLRSVPFLGPLSEQIAQKIAAGQYAGAAGQFAAGAGEPILIPKLAGAVTDIGANARDIPAMAAGAGEGAVSGATAPGTFPIGIKIPGTPYSFKPTGPAAPVGALAGGGVGFKVGGPLGAAAGAIIGASYPIVRGAYRGAVNALEEARAARSLAEFEAQARMFDQFRRAAQGPPDVNFVPPERQLTTGDTIVTAAPADTSSVTAVPGEYAQREPLPPSRQLPPGRQIYQMPAAADTSYVRAVPVGEAPAATEAFNRAPVVNEPPVAAPAATAEVSATAEDLRSAMGLQPGEMEAPAAAPEDTAAAAIARQRNANALIKAISPAGVSSDLAANIPQETWNQIAELAKLPPPDAETIQTVIKTVAAQEGRSAPAPTPAAAAPAPDTPAPAPEPPANAAEELARMMPGYEPPAPEQGPAPATVAESRVEQIAKAVAADQRIPLHIIEDPELYPTFFEQVAQQMKLNRPAPGEPEAILARVRELRGETAEQPPAAAAPPPEEVQARFDREKAATIDLRSAMGLQPGEMEAPAAAPEDTAAAAIARQRNANALIKAISPAGVSSDLAANIPQETWNQIAELAKLPPPDAETIQTVIKTVAAQEGRSAPAPTPAAAAAPAPDTPAPATPPANAAEELARMMPGYEPPAPEQGPAKPTAADMRVEMLSKTLAGYTSIPTSDYTVEALTDTSTPMNLDTLAKSLGIKERVGPGEPERIIARVRELRGETAEQPPVAAAPLAEERLRDTADAPRIDQPSRRSAGARRR